MSNEARLYLRTDRPWMELYGKRVPQAGWALPTSPMDGEEEEEEEPLSLIQRLLSDDVMVQVLRLLPSHTVGRAACVCHSWHRVTQVRCRPASAAPLLPTPSPLPLFQ